MSLQLVFSGGQRGADQGGLAAAYELGIKTGGWVPNGWKTLNGSNPKLKLLGLKQHDSSKYSPRTFTNVKDTDGTIRFAKDFTTAGEKCTLKAIEQYKKPYIDVKIDENIFDEDNIDFVAEWIVANNIERLNVAGNAGSSKKEGDEIFTVVREFLIKVFNQVRG